MKYYNYIYVWFQEVSELSGISTKLKGLTEKFSMQNYRKEGHNVNLRNLCLVADVEINAAFNESDP